MDKKIKEIDFSSLVTRLGFCWIFPDRYSSKELWNRNKISNVWCKIEHTLLLRNHHHYHHLRRPLH